MKIVCIVLSGVMAAVFSAPNAFAEQSNPNDTGEKKFAEQCSVCHVNGGNIINPEKTLLRKDREAYGVKSAEDIIKIMRKPGPGMTTFDEKTISNTDAHAIAEYILRTF